MIRHKNTRRETREKIIAEAKKVMKQKYVITPIILNGIPDENGIFATFTAPVDGTISNVHITCSSDRNFNYFVSVFDKNNVAIQQRIPALINDDINIRKGTKFSVGIMKDSNEIVNIQHSISFSYKTKRVLKHERI